MGWIPPKPIAHAHTPADGFTPTQYNTLHPSGMKGMRVSPWLHGIGIDVTSISRMRTTLQRTPSVLGRLFTPEEQFDALNRGEEGSDGYVAYLAGAFAVKEAVAKAFGTGFREMAWTDIATSRNRLGKPEVHLAGVATLLATRLGIGTVHVSLTSEGDHITAMALAEYDPNTRGSSHDG